MPPEPVPAGPVTAAAATAPRHGERPAATRTPTRGAFLALDIGGTTVKGAAVCDDGTVVTEAAVSTGRGTDALRTVQALARRLVAAARADTVLSIGASVPGLIDATSGTVAYAANLGWRDLPLASLLREEFGTPVRVEHDARAGAVAHLGDRATGPSPTFLFVPVGTGISAGVVVDGRPVGGAAGEFGHVPAVPGGDACTCGAEGCVEAYASAANIVRRYRNRVGSGGGPRSAADIVARTGSDADAALVWSEAVDALATGLIGATALLDPARIVFGGGVSRAGEKLLVPLGDAMRRRMPWRPVPQLQVSPYADKACLIGAGGLALRDLVDPGTHRDLVGRLSAHVAHSHDSTTEQVSTTS